MMDTPTAFLTAETLRTLAGQVMVVMIVTQVVKAAFPTLSAYWLRSVAILAGIAVHEAVVWQRGMPAIDYVLAIANGMLVALTSMKAAEMLKRNAPPRSETLPRPESSPARGSADTLTS